MNYAKIRKLIKAQPSCNSIYYLLCAAAKVPNIILAVAPTADAPYLHQLHHSNASDTKDILEQECFDVWQISLLFQRGSHLFIHHQYLSSVRNGDFPQSHSSEASHGTAGKNHTLPLLTFLHPFCFDCTPHCNHQGCLLLAFLTSREINVDYLRTQQSLYTLGICFESYASNLSPCLQRRVSILDTPESLLHAEIIVHVPQIGIFSTINVFSMLGYLDIKLNEWLY